MSVRGDVLIDQHLSSAPNRAIGFLPDIDGLRALAIIAVLLFHLRVPGFEGGYVGVDIFFVISGFLISGQIRQRIGEDAFALTSFYANRVRRLGPAILATVSFTALASAFLLQPQMLEAFSLSAVASLLSAANVLFFFEAGYWDADSDLKPLLHMWSLGVEEQFYLFWPLLLLVVTQFASRYYIWCLTIIFVASLAACVTYTPVNSAAAFYLLPFRVWQFCLGAIAVEWWRNSTRLEPLAPSLRILGLFLCLISIVMLKNVEFPGWVALVPSLGSALVLVSASPAFSSPFLSNKVVTWVGKVSFSMYLVHWPPIALYRSYTLGEPSAAETVALAGLILVLTFLLHYGVEARFYQRSTRLKGWEGAPLVTLMSGALAAVILLNVYHYPERYAVRPAVLESARIEQYKEDRFKVVRGLCSVGQLQNKRRCPSDLLSPVLFIGNSHEPDAVNTVWSALDGKFRGTVVKFGTINQCGALSVDGDWVKSEVKECQRRLDVLKNSLLKTPWQAIVFSAHRAGGANKAAFLRIFETVKQFQPETRLIVFGDYIATAAECASLINQTGYLDSCGERENVQHFAGDYSAWKISEPRLSEISDFYVDKVALLCRENVLSSCETRTPDGHPMFVDRHHLTWEFASYLGNLIAEDNPTWLQEMSAVPQD